MKRILFSYESPLGTFSILPAAGGKVELVVDGRHLGTFRSPRMAADAVYERTTRWVQWDTDENSEPPSTVSRWKRGSGLGQGRPRGEDDEPDESEFDEE